MRVPKYRRNGDGRAFVAHPSIPTQSHRLYLGMWGARESRQKYEAWVTEFLSTDGNPPPAPSGERPTIAKLVTAYLKYARGYYAVDGVPSKEYDQIKLALRPLLQLFMETIGDEFGPRQLRLLQSHLIQKKYKRGVINLRIGRIKRFFRWCAVEELIPATVFSALQVVPGLRKGRSSARESEPVRPVPMAHVEALMPFLSPVLRAMVQLQYRCGMRPGEVCIMRGCDLDMSGPVWLYRPASHKTQHSGRSLVKAIPSNAQELLKPFLREDPAAYLFSPLESKRWRHEQQRARSQRKTPVYPSELRARLKRRTACNKKRKAGGRGCVGERFTTASYGKAIAYAHSLAQQAGVEIPKWHPHQLRHTIATEISHAIGEQAAQVWLGHASLRTTAIYAERNVAELVGIAERLDKAADPFRSRTTDASSGPAEAGGQNPSDLWFSYL